LFDSANEIVGLTDTEFLQEQGGIAVELSDGTWEVMQYRDVVDGGSGLWTLSHLQRGRLNTVAGSHSVDAVFVLLGNDVVKKSAQSAWLGTTLKHRGVSYDTSAESATVVTTVYTGASQLEWSPASAVAQYDGATVFVSDIVPRHRFGTEVRPIASTNFIGYRVTVTDGTANASVDILSGNSGDVDVTSLGDITEVRIVALNRITDAGQALVVPADALTPPTPPDAVVGTLNATQQKNACSIAAAVDVPINPPFSQVVALLHFNGTNGSTTVTDNAGTPNSFVMSGSGALSTAITRFGTASYKPGSSGVLKLSGSPGSQLLIDTNEYALELWVYPLSAANAVLVNLSPTNGYTPIGLHYVGGKIQLVGYNDALSGGALGTSRASLNVNAWNFIQLRFRKDFTVSTAYWELGLDGVLDDWNGVTVSTATNWDAYATGDFAIGNYGSGGFPLDGYIDELRMTIGSITAINLPTTAFPDS
jgi:hypothetical protein